MSDPRLLDCNAPGFIKRFFTTSRLHHLSTWKADIADFVMGHMSAKSRSSAASGFKASQPKEPFRTIMHIDMDCFFASVGIRDRPHLAGKPVAVAHSQGGISLDYSTSEIASCNYEARAKGVKNGIFIGSAKELAPDLIIIPYEFEQYDACSKVLYRTLINTADFVQSVSCDEAFVDVTFCIQKRLMEATTASSIQELLILSERDASFYQLYEDLTIQLANEMRGEIFQQTRCHASVGIASNILLARVATSKAKPNGVHSLLQREKGLLHLKDMPIRGLPGVGRSTSDKCASLQLHTCGDVQAAGERNSTVLAQLRKELGEKTGEGLLEFCWGRDDRVLENKPRQSVGSDINWGIRFTNPEQVDSFLREYCVEVFDRLDRTMHTAGHVTINLKKKLYEGEPGKFLGCGHCQDFSRSVVPGRAIASAEALHRCVSMLYKEVGLHPLEVRGVGIHLRKLQQRQAGGGVLFKTTISLGKNQGERMMSRFLRQGNQEEEEEIGKEGRADDRDIVAAKEQVTDSIRNYFPEKRTAIDSAADDAACVDASEQMQDPLAAPAIADLSTDMMAGSSGNCPDTGTGTQDSVESLWVELSPPSARTSPSHAVSFAKSRLKQSVFTPVLAVCENIEVDAAETSLEANRDPSEPTNTSTGANADVGTSTWTSASASVVMSMEDVDLDVFLALPEDIQRELQRAFLPTPTPTPTSTSTHGVPKQSRAAALSSPPRKRTKTAGKSTKSAGSKPIPAKSSTQPSILSIWGGSK